MMQSIKSLFGLSSGLVKQEKQWSFPTIPERDPLTITLTLNQVQPLSPGGPLLAGNVHCDIKGVHHPYDPQHRFTLLGDEMKNPALLPVLNFLRTALPTAINHFFTNKKPVEITESLEGFSIGKTLNGLTWFRWREAAKAEWAFEQLITEIETLVPHIRQLIDQNKNRQPPLNPGPGVQMAFEQDVERAWEKFKNAPRPPGIEHGFTDSPDHRWDPE